MVELVDTMSAFLVNVRKIHGPYQRRDGRSHVVIVYNDGSKRTVSYPKFLVEFALGRTLDPHKETIDHLDGDFTNNAWSNLRIVPRGKHVSEDLVAVAEVIIKCVWCGNLAKRRPSQLNRNAKLGKAGPFCTNTCASQYGRAVQLDRIAPFPAQPYVPTSERLYQKRVKHGGLRVADVIDASITERDVLQHCSKR